jgi:hypothetical protein
MLLTAGIRVDKGTNYHDQLNDVHSSLRMTLQSRNPWNLVSKPRLL